MCLLPMAAADLLKIVQPAAYTTRNAVIKMWWRPTQTDRIYRSRLVRFACRKAWRVPYFSNFCRITKLHNFSYA